MEKDSIENSVGSSTDAVKPRFSEVCQNYDLDYHAMGSIAKKAKLSKCVIDAMAVCAASVARKFLLKTGKVEGK